MQTYELTLQSKPSDSFRCIKAANSMDIDVEKKLTHHFSVAADIETPFNIGLIVGASGSGKTTLAREMFGDCFKSVLNHDKTIIDQFPGQMSYDDCSVALGGAGLSAVTCWLRPVKTLSNGQTARAELALRLASDDNLIVIDEFTSVVDRTVAKAMAHTVQKVARKTNRRIVLLSCHYDIIEWLNPCWIIDCNKQTYTDRRAFFLNTNATIDYSLSSANVTNPLGAILANITI
jgi:ABC-type ATPase with predicted acetyltransferase domain